MTEPGKHEPQYAKLNALIVLGVAWMLLSGACTAVVAVPALFSRYGGWFGVLGLLVGVVSFGIGLAIWLAGRANQKRRDRSTGD
ncbi:MAG: hypothetical protein R3C25_12435 [Hyphomonadaceae bacterium]